MFVVIGEWRMAPELREAQDSGLQGIVAGVSGLPGFVSGWWTRSDDGTSSHTFIVFDSRAAAEAFASNVRGNLDNQRTTGVANLSLRIETVSAHTSA